METQPIICMKPVEAQVLSLDLIFLELCYLGTLPKAGGIFPIRLYASTRHMIDMVDINIR